jgi:hypothetical protein
VQQALEFVNNNETHLEIVTRHIALASDSDGFIYSASAYDSINDEGPFRNRSDKSERFLPII